MPEKTFRANYQILIDAQKLEAAKKLVKARGYWSLPFFARFFLHHHVPDPFGQHHHEIFARLTHDMQGKKLNIVAPRGSAKSTIATIIYPIWRVCYAKYDEIMKSKGHHREKFILIISKSHQMAAARVRDIQKELESNDKIISHFGNLRGTRNWGMKSLVTANNIQIVSHGRRGQVRGSLFDGHRPTLIITDDLDDPETVLNEKVRAKDLKWFNDDLLHAGSLDGTTNFINIDTIKHKYATTSQLMDRPGWETLFFQAIPHPKDLYHPLHEDIWKQWVQLYTDTSLPDKEQADAFYLQHKEDMTADVEELWPERLKYIDVRKEMCDVGYNSVMRELQNTPVDRRHALFEMDKALRFGLVQEGFLRSDKVLVRWNEISGATVFLDWAGGKDLKENCFACVVSVVWVPQPGGRDRQTSDAFLGGTHGYVLFDWLDKIGHEKQIQACLNMIDKLHSTLKNRDIKIQLGIEGFVQDTWEAQKKVIEQDYKTQRDKRGGHGIYPAIKWLPRLHNKYDRIDALQAPIFNRWLGFHEKLSSEFMTQMSDYPTGDYLDAPDALEGACQIRVSRFERERRERKIRSQRQAKAFHVEI